MNKFLAIFIQEYYPVLGIRADTFKELFQYMDRQGKLWSIVETGCVRIPNNWAGDGQSSILFDRYIDLNGGRFHTVDMDPQAVNVAYMSVSRRTNVVLNDSVAFLAQFGQPIDLLYLDSFDLNKNDPLPSSLHHLKELCAAQRWLHPGSLVMVDDTYWEGDVCLGKGKLVAEYMKDTGAKHLVAGYQDLWLI